MLSFRWMKNRLFQFHFHFNQSIGLRQNVQWKWNDFVHSKLASHAEMIDTVVCRTHVIERKLIYAVSFTICVHSLLRRRLHLLVFDNSVSNWTDWTKRTVCNVYVCAVHVFIFSIFLVRIAFCNKQLQIRAVGGEWRKNGAHAFAYCHEQTGKHRWSEEIKCIYARLRW